MKTSIADLLMLVIAVAVGAAPVVCWFLSR